MPVLCIPPNHDFSRFAEKCLGLNPSIEIVRVDHRTPDHQRVDRLTLLNDDKIVVGMKPIFDSLKG